MSCPEINIRSKSYQENLSSERRLRRHFRRTHRPDYYKRFFEIMNMLKHRQRIIIKKFHPTLETIYENEISKNLFCLSDHYDIEYIDLELDPDIQSIIISNYLQ